MRDLYRSRQLKARKLHFCDLCYQAIAPGTQYIYTVSRINGTVWPNKMHVHCDAIQQAFMSAPEFDGNFTSSNIAVWYATQACQPCPKWIGDDGVCGLGVFACPEAAKKVLNPTVLGAALESIRECEKVGDEE